MEHGQVMLQDVLRILAYHAYSVWLFTFSDIKTIIAPSVVFGVAHAFAHNHTGIQQHYLSSLLETIESLPRISLWVWINLLPFTISNQRQHPAIEEDAINKPWRTMPSKRMTIKQATELMYCLYLLAITVSLRVGGMRQSLALIFLGYWYNDLGGADTSCIIRNFINACGFICFASGALEVAIERSLQLDSQLVLWLGVIFTTVFLTVQTQDMYDQTGDQQRGRRTVPLELGDAAARLTIAIPMAILCWVCPRFWRVPPLGYVGPVALGTTVAVRTLTYRDVSADKVTFRIWNLWMVSLYTLPALSVLVVAPRSE